MHTQVFELVDALGGDSRLSWLLLLLDWGNALDGGIDLGEWFCHVEERGVCVLCVEVTLWIGFAYEQMIVSGMCDVLTWFAGVSEEENEGKVVEGTKEGKVGRSFIGFTSALARHGYIMSGQARIVH